MTDHTPDLLTENKRLREIIDQKDAHITALEIGQSRLRATLEKIAANGGIIASWELATIARKALKGGE